MLLGILMHRAKLSKLKASSSLEWNMHNIICHLLFCSRCCVCSGGQYLENKARICVSTSSWTGSGISNFLSAEGQGYFTPQDFNSQRKCTLLEPNISTLLSLYEAESLHWRDSIVLCVPDRGKEYPSWVISLPESCHRRVPECQQQAESCKSELVLGVVLDTAETDSSPHGDWVHFGMGKKRKTW